MVAHLSQWAMSMNLEKPSESDWRRVLRSRSSIKSKRFTWVVPKLSKGKPVASYLNLLTHRWLERISKGRTMRREQSLMISKANLDLLTLLWALLQKTITNQRSTRAVTIKSLNKSLKPRVFKLLQTQNIRIILMWNSARGLSTKTWLFRTFRVGRIH